MIVDLKTDTANIAESIHRNYTFNLPLSDSLLKYLDIDNPNDEAKIAIVTYARKTGWTDFISFTKRTITQLKNTGGLRLIKNQAVSDSIMTYDERLAEIEQQENAYIEFTRNTIATADKLFDFRKLRNKDLTMHNLMNIRTWLLANSKPSELFLIQNPNELKQFANAVNYRKAVILQYVQKIKILKKQAEQLSRFLEKEYELE